MNQKWPSLVLALLCSSVAIAAVDPTTASTTAPVETIRFDPAQGCRIATDGKWIVWTRRTADPRTIQHEVIRYSVDYFLQKLDSDELPIRLPYTGGGQNRDLAAVVDDRTVLLLADFKLHWITADTNPAATQPATQPTTLSESDPALDQIVDQFHVVRLDPEGIIGQTITRPAIDPATGKPVLQKLWWIPIVGHHPDLNSKVLLDESVDPNAQISFIRHGDEIAWLNPTRITHPPGGQIPRTVVGNVFSVPTQKVRLINPTETVPGSKTRLCGFDGTTLFDGYRAIDVATGQVSTVAFVPADIGLVGGVIYGVRRGRDDEFDLIATPIADHKHSHRAWSFPTTPREIGELTTVGLPARDIFLDDDGKVRSWDGKHWAVLPIKN